MGAMKTVIPSNTAAAESRARRLGGRVSIPRVGTMAACGRAVAMLLTLASFQFALAETPPKNFVLHDLPKPVAAVSFEGDQRRPLSLANFNRKMVILNIWSDCCRVCLP